jgi:hypothetical protein
MPAAPKSPTESTTAANDRNTATTADDPRCVATLISSDSRAYRLSRPGRGTRLPDPRPTLRNCPILPQRGRVPLAATLPTCRRTDSKLSARDRGFDHVSMRPQAAAW